MWLTGELYVACLGRSSETVIHTLRMLGSRLRYRPSVTQHPGFRVCASMETRQRHRKRHRDRETEV
jgi:hypothetical protein